MKILQLTCHFEPNIGGVETHLHDLVEALQKRGHKVFVLTYQPLTTKARWKNYERRKSIEILRIPWLSGLFYKYINKPALEFIYLFPGIFIGLPFVIIKKNPDVINAHGLIAGAAGVFWGRIFGKPVIISLHSIYSFPQKGLYKRFVEMIFNNADKILGLSRQSENEILKVTQNKTNAGHFTYWVDLSLFHKINRAKELVNWKGRFVVLYVGRLVTEKGILPLIKSAKKWRKEINLAIIGTGPLENSIKNVEKISKNITFVGKVENEKLPPYYSAADLVIVPSVSEEGFGRVILESLACGTPVIGANRGAIPEAIDERVGKLINVSPKSIKESVEYFYKNPAKLSRLSNNARKFALERFSEKNVEYIIQKYASEKNKK